MSNDLENVTDPLSKKSLEGRRPPYGLVECIRCWNDIHLARQDGLSEDGLSLRKVRLDQGAPSTELEANRDIRDEVFGVRLSEVDETIRNRFQAENSVSKEDELSPAEFWLN